MFYVLQEQRQRMRKLRACIPAMNDAPAELRQAFQRWYNAELSSAVELVSREITAGSGCNEADASIIATALLA